jgi:hypothetical protein
MQKIRGYNCPPKQLTLQRVDELASTDPENPRAMGLKSLRIVEPYGFVTDDHIKALLARVTLNGGESIVTLFNSNPTARNVVTESIWRAFLAQEKQDEGKATRSLIAMGVRVQHEGIIDWMIDEAQRIRKLCPAQTKIEIFNPDILYWGTNWNDMTKLLPEYEALCRLLRPGTCPTYTGFSWLEGKLLATWRGLWSRKISGGFMYGESGRVALTGDQKNLMEFGVNVHTRPDAFIPQLQAIKRKYRVYLQWLVDPAFDGYSNVTPEVLWDETQTKALYAATNYRGDSYSMLPVLGWDAIRAFAAS